METKEGQVVRSIDEQSGRGAKQIVSRGSRLGKTVLGIFAASCLLLSGCTAGADSQSESNGDQQSSTQSASLNAAQSGQTASNAGQTRQIGYIRGLGTSTFDQERNESVVTALQQDLAAQVVQPDSLSSVADQCEALIEMVDQGIETIVFVPSANDMWIEAVEYANAAGVQTIAVGGVLETPLSQIVTTSYYASGNDEGTEAAEWVIENAAGEQVVELAASDNQLQYLRQRTLNLYLGDQLVGVVENVDQASDGPQLLDSVLEAYPQASVLVVESESAVGGIVQAIELSELAQSRDLKVVTFGGAAATFEMLRAGDIDYLVYRDPYLGARVVEIIEHLDSGGTMKSGSNVQVVGYDSTVSAEMAAELAY